MDVKEEMVILQIPTLLEQMRVDILNYLTGSYTLSQEEIATYPVVIRDASVGVIVNEYLVNQGFNVLFLHGNIDRDMSAITDTIINQYSDLLYRRLREYRLVAPIGTLTSLRVLTTDNSIFIAIKSEG